MMSGSRSPSSETEVMQSAFHSLDHPHYRARIFLLGPVEFDHGDLYRDLDAVLTAFRAGTAQVPRDEDGS